MKVEPMPKPARAKKPLSSAELLSFSAFVMRPMAVGRTKKVPRMMEYLACRKNLVMRMARKTPTRVPTCKAHVRI